MIAYLRGVVVRLTPEIVVLDVNGVGYLLSITGQGGSGPPFRNPPLGAALGVGEGNSNGRDEPGLRAANGETESRPGAWTRRSPER